MICSHSYCNNSGDNEKIIACWICQQIYHTKCLNVPDHVADDINRNLGLRWCCINCKKYDIDFFKFMKTNRDKFNDLKKEFLVFSSMLNKYEKVFDSFNSLDNVCNPLNGISPKRKRTSKRIAAKSTDANYNPTEVINIDSAIPSTININSPIIPIIKPITTIQSIDQNNIINNQNNYANLNNNTEEYPTTSSSSNTVAATPLVNKKSQKKTIFVARLSSDTSTADITNYINFKLGQDCQPSVYKFNYAEERSKASFKVIIPQEYFNAVIDSSFWPDKTIIREYIYKEKSRNDIAHLPKFDVSKN